LNVDKSLASTERLRFKEVISWIFTQSVWTDTNSVDCVGIWKLAFSVLVLIDITTQEMQFIEILHTVH